MDTTTFLTILSVVASVALVVITAVYACLTRGLVQESQKMRETQTNPNIGIWIEQREEAPYNIHLVIKNVGLGPAYNLKFTVDPEFKDKRGKALSERGIIKNGISYLAPNRNIHFYLTDSIKDTKEMPTRFEIAVNYENAIKYPFSESFSIDFSYFSGLD